MALARARTDSKGYQLLGDISIADDLVAHRLGERRRNPFDIEIPGKNIRKKNLGDLLGEQEEPFHLLATYLVNNLGYHPATPCVCGRWGVIRSIKIGAREWRADALNIFAKERK